MRTIIYLLGFLLLLHEVHIAAAKRSRRYEFLEKREEKATDDHDHDHDHEGMCIITGPSLAMELNELAEDKASLNCTFNHHHDHDHMGVAKHYDDDEDEVLCGDVYNIVSDLLVHLNVTTSCCLGDNISHCEDANATSAPESPRIPASEAYGYGFLMVFLVSLASLIGLAIVPVLNNKKLESYYQYFYAILIALGASALFCDAVLHLIPEAFGLHDHSSSDHDDDHDHEDHEDRTVLWRSVVVILGLYAFFLFEFLLHSCTSHSHSHSHSPQQKNTSEEHSEQNKAVSSLPDGNGKDDPQKYGTTAEVMFPHGECHDTNDKAPILHPSAVEDAGNKTRKTFNVGSKVWHYILNIKPLAWLIIVGDSLHNFADGLAIGAAISQNLSLGISTTIAVVFHEIPHELGDFAILLSTGMVWYVAISINFISALTAVVGFFVGVAIGTNVTGANFWVLSITAGIFIYIALVDLLPELIHSKEKDFRRFIKFTLVNIGFFISFVAMFLLAFFEEELNRLVED